MPYVYVPDQHQEEPFPVLAFIMKWGVGLTVTAICTLLLVIGVREIWVGRVAVNFLVVLSMFMASIPPMIFLWVMYGKFQNLAGWISSKKTVRKNENKEEFPEPFLD